jgi:uncharacterized protein YjbI with pentapeptide repeats
MDTKHRHLWWTLGSLIAMLCLGLILAANRFAWTSTGFQGKTMWDWLQLLIVPLVLALVAIVFNQVNTGTERRVALDKQREDLLQSYLDRMSELLLEKGLRTSPPDAEVRNVARARTISILKQLDVKRVEYVFTFLQEAGLLSAPQPIVNLSRAQFTKVNWSQIDLRRSNLSGVDLSEANLDEADLSGANLSGAILRKANLKKAILLGANLSGTQLDLANLTRATLNATNLTKATFCGARLCRATFGRANLDRTRLSGAYLSRAYLGGVDLSKASFDRASLRRAYLSRAELNKILGDENQLTTKSMTGTTL